MYGVVETSIVSIRYVDISYDDLPKFEIAEMSIIIKTGFESIFDNICFQPGTIPEGKQLVDSGHVCNIQEFRENGHSYLIKALVIRQTSVTSPLYDTQIKIDDNRQVIDASCTCVYNKSGKCKHIAAVIYYINNEKSLTKTDFAQLWGKPTARKFAQQKYSKGKYFYEMFPSKNMLSSESSNFDISELQTPSALRTIMVEATKNEDDRVINCMIDTMLKQVVINVKKEECEKCLHCFFKLCDIKQQYQIKQVLPKHLFDFYKGYIVLSREKIVQLCCDTLEQSKCAEWFAARRMRVSASQNAHNIKRRVTKTIDSLIDQMLYPAKIDTPAIRYGKKYEKDARKEYKSLYNVSVIEVGVIVSQQQPWLCASLDGVVMHDSSIANIVEFKCPLNCKDKGVFSSESNKCNVNYLINVNNQVMLNPSSAYYTQCQLQIYVSGVNLCHLFIYSQAENGSYCVPVQRDEEFLKVVIEACERFFFQHYLPALHSLMIGNDTQRTDSTTQSSQLPKRKFTGSDINNII